ncbi:hypothetical protein [Streptomyces sp. NPDC057257]|uniref:hypothetical protein n=1 Tax=Streptomyces sp. NPDC057257 TaxID=3346071 RepID=UPI003629349B
MPPELVFDEAALGSALEGLTEQQDALLAATCMEYLLPGAARYASEIDPKFQAEIVDLADQVWRCVSTPGPLNPEFGHLSQKAADIESRAQEDWNPWSDIAENFATSCAVILDHLQSPEDRAQLTQVAMQSYEAVDSVVSVLTDLQVVDSSARNAILMSGIVQTELARQRYVVEVLRTSSWTIDDLALWLRSTALRIDYVVNLDSLEEHS